MCVQSLSFVNLFEFWNFVFTDLIQSYKVLKFLCIHGLKLVGISCISHLLPHTLDTFVRV